MAWREVGKVELRKLFIRAVESGAESMSEVCREFSISRKTGYKWLGRYHMDGDAGLVDCSRRPKGIRYGTDPEVKELLLKERRAHPAWGVRKLCKRLERRGVVPPPERTANRILRREGMIEPRAGREGEPQRFERAHPNELWQIDHKSAIHGAWSRRTVPFTVIDDCSRYLLGLWALPDKGLVSSWGALWDILGEFGLPEAILTDNDQVFHGTNGPSQFEARLLRLGVEVLHGRAYHPQTQGKVERVHGTLELELLRNGSFRSCEELQAGFDRFRDEYNFGRPHEALGMDVPGAHYRPSTRRRPDVIPEMEYPSGAVLRKVQKDGWVSWKGYCIEVGMGLHKERVEIREAEDGIEVYYGGYRILGKTLDEHTKKRSDKVGGAGSPGAWHGGTSLRATPSAPFPHA